MAVGLDSVRVGGVPDEVDRAVRRLDAEWQRGRPDLAVLWGEHQSNGSVHVLAALVKADLSQRFARGERPEVAEYLDEFPQLRTDPDRVLSLVYEEYCLREEQGERPDTAEFCERYAEWKDSLESQLKYHRVISRVVGTAPPPIRFPEPGETFEQFSIGRELGHGGSAKVYLARDHSLGGRSVVLKVSADRGSEPAILGRLEHPHIMAVHTVVTQPATNLRGLCMPYRPGRPLDEVIAAIRTNRRPDSALGLLNVVGASREPVGVSAAGRSGNGWVGFPVRGTYADAVAWVVATLADALTYAHGQNVYHRDVKPANVLLTYRDGPQLLDFNLSHDHDSAEQAQAALRGGTLPYMAPEQLEAFLDPACWGNVLAPADVYSLGLLARELLTGLPPDTPDPTVPLPRAIRGLLDRRARGGPGVRQADPKIPHDLESIIELCLAYRPEDRYQRAEDLAFDLRRHLARRPLRYAPNRSSRERLLNWSRRHRVALGAFALATLVALPTAAERVDLRFRPPETRAGFLSAVGELDTEHHTEALSDLSQLPESHRLTPVVGFHLANAYSHRGRLPEALKSFIDACRDRTAEERLGEWGKGHPEFVKHAEYLGARLLDPSVVPEETSREPALRQAERLFRLVLQIDPRRFLPRQGLAVIDEYRGKHGSAHQRLTEMIEELGQTRLPSYSKYKAQRHLLQVRGRNALAWGNGLRLKPEGHSEADVRLLGAQADLDRALRLVLWGDPSAGFNLFRLVVSGELAAVFDLDYLRCEVLLARSELASQHQEVEAAISLAREADQLLEDLYRLPETSPGVLDKLKRKVQERKGELGPGKPGASH